MASGSDTQLLTGSRHDDQQRAAVAVTRLVKRYPKARTNAVDGISFAVRRGEVFGLLGPNGAGKTTTVGVLTTRVRPTAGSALVAGVDVIGDPVGARTVLAVVPQRNNLDRALSIRQNLLFHAAYHGVGRAEARRRAASLLEEFGLTERAGDKPDFVSGGQAQRIMIARALMHHPEVLFLDEPSTGLDPAARLFVWDRIRDLRARGVTVMLTTHDMEEAATLADRVGIMDHGKLLALDTPGALTRALPGSQTLDVAVILDGHEPATFLAALAGLDGVERVERVDDVPTGAAATPGAPPADEAAGDVVSDAAVTARLFVSRDAPVLVAPLARLLGDLGVTLTDVNVGRPSLEDVFISFTGRTLR